MDFLPQTGPDTFTGYSDAPEGMFGGWGDTEHEAERAYLGTLMLKKPGGEAAQVRLEPLHFSSTLRGRMLEGLRGLYPWADSAKMEMDLCYSLSRQFGLKVVQLEVGQCLGHSEPWREVDSIAARVLEGWKRRQRASIVEGMRACCHDSEAIAAECEKLLALG